MTTPPDPDQQPPSAQPPPRPYASEPEREYAAPPPPRPQRPAGAPEGDPLVPRDFGSWAGRISDTFGRSWWPLFALSLVSAAPLALSGHYTGKLADRIDDASGSDGQFTASELRSIDLDGLAGPLLLSALLTLVVAILVQTTSVWFVVRQAAGEALDLNGALRFGLRRGLPFIGWGLVAGVLLVVGFTLFLIPGLYLLVIFLPTLTGVVLIERKGIGRCFSLVQGRFMATLGRTLLFGLIVLLYMQAVASLSQTIFDGSTIGYVVEAVVQAPAMVMTAAFSVISYAELRAVKQQVSTRSMLSEMTA